MAQLDQNRIANQLLRVFKDIHQYDVPLSLTFNADESGHSNLRFRFTFHA